ncbi:hypothetical protein HN51_041871 [Arachis hypogaea]
MVWQSTSSLSWSSMVSKENEVLEMPSSPAEQVLVVEAVLDENGKELAELATWCYGGYGVLGKNNIHGYSESVNKTPSGKTFVKSNLQKASIGMDNLNA